MMIPPVVRTGQPSRDHYHGEQYVALIRHRGWKMIMMDIHAPGRAWYYVTEFNIVYVPDPDILCWMPQDGT